MSAVKRRGSLLGGLLFTSLGVILLAQNLGYSISFWLIAEKYWPLLLILVGLAKIIDYFRFGAAVSIKFRDVLTVVFIIFFGLIAGKIAALNLDLLNWDFPVVWHPRGFHIRDLNQNSYIYNDEFSYPCAANASFSIENAEGDVEIQPGAVGEMKIKLRKKVYENTEEKAKKIAQQIKLIYRQESGGCAVKTNREELSGAKKYKYETRMSILIPKQAHITVRNNRGDVRLEGFSGDQQVHCSGGRVIVSDINGNLEASNRDESMSVTNVSGNAEISCKNTKVFVERIGGDLSLQNLYSRSEVHDVTGKVSLKNKDGSLRVERVKGTLEVEAARSNIEVLDADGEVQITSSHNNPIIVENAASNVHISSSYGSVAAKNIKGNLTVTTNNSEVRVAGLSGALDVKGEISSIQAEEIKGAAAITNTRGDVVVNSFESPVHIRNEYGDVSVAAGRELKSNLDIANRNGKIELVLPEDSKFNIQALSKSGGVESEFTGQNLKIVNDGDSSIAGSYGNGGPIIRLETSYSTINLRKGTEARLLRYPYPLESDPSISKPSRRHKRSKGRRHSIHL